MRGRKAVNTKSLPFVKYHTGLSYLFSPAETRFILHMVDIEYKKSSGFFTNWSRYEYMKIMGLNEYTFDKCIQKLSDMHLLKKENKNKPNRVYYSFNMQLYERLIYILSSTCNIDKLRQFCKINFIEKSRHIDSISEQEVENLASFENIELVHPALYKGK